MAEGFENYLKNSVIDLSKIEDNRKDTKSRENQVIAFTGSKLWLDLQLDTGYFLYHLNNDTCVKFCYETNYKKHMQKLVEDSNRHEAMGCHFNCLNKITHAADLVKNATKNHPRAIGNSEKFAKIDEEITKYNEEYVLKQNKLNYSF